jgi:hypothetical protein
MPGGEDERKREKGKRKVDGGVERRYTSRGKIKIFLFEGPDAAPTIVNGKGSLERR